MGIAVGIDLGGTKLAAGLVDDAGVVIAMQRRNTPDGADAVVAAIVSLICGLGPDAAGAPIGIGAAGFVDAAREQVLFAPNLVWSDVPLAALVAAQLGGSRRVVLENDANAAAWAEARFGAGAVSSMVLVTVGTGIGGGIVLDGALHRGGFGLAGEFGHLPLVEGGRLCGCGQSGCWEQYASGNALTRAARDLVRSGSSAAAALRAACDGDPEALVGAHIGEAAAGGDPAAVELLAELGRRLGAGLAAVAAVLDPEVFVIGGGVVANADLLLEPARTEFHRRLPAADRRPVAEIRAATLGPAAGLVGAADLARVGAG